MQDLRDAFRSLLGSPVVSIVAIVSLALGIGANTAIFSILDSLMLRSVPVHEADRLGLMTYEDRGSGSWTNPIWEQIRLRSDLFEGALAWSTARFNTSRRGQTEFISGIWVSGSYFDVLGVPAILGRTLAMSDDERGGGPDGPVAVISHGFWQRRFAGAADVIGKPLTLERVNYTIVGVTPPEFFGLDVGQSFDVAIPLGSEPLMRGDESWLDARSTWWLDILVRLQSEQTLTSATAALQGIQPRVREATLPDRWQPEHLKRYLKTPLRFFPAANGISSLRNRYQQPLIVILVVVGLVLLIACANIANLLLARATARRHELSVRLALGASSFRLTRQLLTESLLLSGIGASLGLVFAKWGSLLLVNQLSNRRTTVFLDLSLDWRILAFTAAVAIGTAVLFGTAPALRAGRIQPNEALVEHGRSAAGDRSLGLRNLLVVAQVVLSLMLVIGAGLFMRTFATLANLDLGFDRDPIMVVRINAQTSGVEAGQRAALYERVRQAILALPGVSNAAVSAVTPVSGSTWNTTLDLPEMSAASQQDRMTNLNYLSPEWFSTYGTPILAGRDLELRDREGGPHVGLVNQTFANKFFGGASPLGEVVHLSRSPGEENPPIEIVGLVGDAAYRSLREEIPPTLYLAIAQEEMPWSQTNISVRSETGSVAGLTRSIVNAVETVDSELALTFRPLADQINSALAQERLVAVLSMFFGVLAILLAGLGLYGLMSYSVNQRRFEIGIRMALGAEPRGVVRMILLKVGLLVGSGVVVGGLAGVWTARLAESLLYGLQPHDPLTLALAAGVLFAVGALSGWIPARRAARIDPARVLRDG